jgi:hypothetical protein
LHPLEKRLTNDLFFFGSHLLRPPLWLFPLHTYP